MKLIPWLMLIAVSSALTPLPAHADTPMVQPLPSAPIAGKLTSSDPPDPVRKDCRHHVYTWALDAGKTYWIDVASTDFDAYLRLEDAKGQRLAEDDDSGGGFDARLVFSPSRSGPYRVIVTTFGPGQTGAYSLKVRQGGASKSTDGGEETTIPGELTEADPTDRVRTGRHCKIHQIVLQARRTYQLDLVSQDFDAYLRLEDDKGQKLGEDDDGGTDFNARLIFTPSRTSTYRVIATTYYAGETGRYTLTVRELPPPRRE